MDVGVLTAYMDEIQVMFDRKPLALFCPGHFSIRMLTAAIATFYGIQEGSFYLYLSQRVCEPGRGVRSYVSREFEVCPRMAGGTRQGAADGPRRVTSSTRSSGTRASSRSPRGGGRGVYATASGDVPTSLVSGGLVFQNTFLTMADHSTLTRRRELRRNLTEGEAPQQRRVGTGSDPPDIQMGGTGGAARSDPRSGSIQGPPATADEGASWAGPPPPGLEAAAASQDVSMSQPEGDRGGDPGAPRTPLRPTDAGGSSASRGGRRRETRRPRTEERHRHTEGDDLWCPVATCPAADRQSHLPWRSVAGLKAHIDARLAGILPGNPDEDWLRSCRWKPCLGCARTLGPQVTCGWHKRCWANHQSTRVSASQQMRQLPAQYQPVDERIDGDLPDWEEIAAA